MRLLVLLLIVAAGLSPFVLPTDALAKNHGPLTFGYDSTPQGEKELIAAQSRRKGLNFVEVRDVEVVRILADDNEGNRHQKFVVRLSNDTNVEAIYNTSICDRVPVKLGDRVSLGGQYIWDNDGGIIHWLHEDPRNRRPDGYVEHNGRRYGAFDGKEDRRR